MNKSPFLLPALLALSASALAQEPAGPTFDRARKAPVFTIYFENDTFADTDRYYTNGAKLSWISGDLSGWGRSGGQQAALERVPLVNDPGTMKNFGFAFGQNIYTPRDQDLVIPDPDDRPYAGWSYLEFSLLSKSPHQLDIISLQVGMVGPHSYAQEVQNGFHDWIRNSPSRGWDSQLHDEVGVNLIVERRWRLFARAFDGALGFDFVPHIGASLGNVATYANIGASTRLGFNLPEDFGVDLIRGAGVVNTPIDDNDPRVGERTSLSLFLFAGADGRAVARDIFLDGNTFRDSPSVDKEDFVADLSVGAGLVLGRWQLTYTHVLRTREFEGQDKPNRFGSVTLSRTF